MFKPTTQCQLHAPDVNLIRTWVSKPLIGYPFLALLHSYVGIAKPEPGAGQSELRTLTALGTPIPKDPHMSARSLSEQAFPLVVNAHSS